MAIEVAAASRNQYGGMLWPNAAFVRSWIRSARVPMHHWDAGLGYPQSIDIGPRAVALPGR